MTVAEFCARLKYQIEHPKCKRCGKELYIPEPPEELRESWGIFAWTAFVKQYVKHHGWFELGPLDGNIICPDCIKPTDTLNTIMLDSYAKWIEKYNEWRKEVEG